MNSIQSNLYSSSLSNPNSDFQQFSSRSTEVATAVLKFAYGQGVNSEKELHDLEQAVLQYLENPADNKNQLLLTKKLGDWSEERLQKLQDYLQSEGFSVEGDSLLQASTVEYGNRHETKVPWYARIFFILGLLTSVSASSSSRTHPCTTLTGLTVNGRPFSLEQGNISQYDVPWIADVCEAAQELHLSGRYDFFLEKNSPVVVNGEYLPDEDLVKVWANPNVSKEMLKNVLRHETHHAETARENELVIPDKRTPKPCVMFPKFETICNEKLFPALMNDLEMASKETLPGSKIKALQSILPSLVGVKVELETLREREVRLWQTRYGKANLIIDKKVSDGGVAASLVIPKEPDVALIALVDILASVHRKMLPYYQSGRDPGQLAGEVDAMLVGFFGRDKARLVVSALQPEALTFILGARDQIHEKLQPQVTTFNVEIKRSSGGASIESDL